VPKASRGDDAFGAALLDWVQGGKRCEVLERDDGHVEHGPGPKGYLSNFRSWPVGEREALKHLRGRIVDVGCGAGRVAIVLQERGLDVIGLDASPLAIRAARTLGVRSTRCADLQTLSDELCAFDSILLFGNNFGLFGTPLRARQMLSRWARRASPGMRVFAESTNPYSGGAPIVDRAYYWRNKARGVAPGQTKYRILYRDLVGPWHPWLFVSQEELRTIARGTGWRIASILGDGPIEPYVAVLELASPV
jgi:SAM-dependent methyltransferase